jgi:hypothetical protein
MMEQYLELLPPVPGPHPHGFMTAILLLILPTGQLLYLLCVRRRLRQYQWRRGVRPRRLPNTRG